MSGKSSRKGGLAGSWVGSGGVGDAIGISIPGVITCPGLDEGDAVGICIPGVITCPGVGDAVGICIPGVITCPGVGDAFGICMPGVITCPGEGDGLGLDTLRAGGRLARVAVLFFLGALFGFGVIFDMSC